MMKKDEPVDLVSVLGPPAIVAITALLLILLPSEMRIALTVWVLVSFPIGILAGHCVLSEE
jgi:hypothetical protein